MSEPRHVLGISGGKDSAALAIHMRDRVPQMEYFFCDTGRELPETYEYLQRLETVLGKPIERLNADRDFDHWLWVFGGALPSPQMRWCTKNLKIKPLEEWLGDDVAVSYVGIRADEHRDGYVSRKPNITAVFPFKEDNIDLPGVMAILEQAGVGLPDYYRWRTRSGCFFCFYQRKIEWVRLADEHPLLFERAMRYEEKASFEAQASGRQFTWSQGESLVELLARRADIQAQHEAAMNRAKKAAPNRPLSEVLGNVLDGESADGCAVCHV